MIPKQKRFWEGNSEIASNETTPKKGLWSYLRKRVVHIWGSCGGGTKSKGTGTYAERVLRV